MPGCRPWHSTAVVQRVKGYEAVPIWRPSTTRPRSPEERHLNLKIVPKGIRDFGADKGYTPLDLVMVACECDLDTAFRFLSERLNWAPDIDHLGCCSQSGQNRKRPSRIDKWLSRAAASG